MQPRLEIRRAAECRIEVISSLWDAPLEFFSGDLSPRGAYLYSELLPDPGEHVVCSLELGLSDELGFFAEVVRVNLLRRACDKGRPGFGVRFLDAGPFDRLRIRDKLRGLPPPLPVPRRHVDPPRSARSSEGRFL
jgi:hypothetical protein